MKKYLLPESGRFYKANLHCHSDRSDGHLSPAELKKVYQAHGYSIIAYTDHDVFLHHDDLRDETFLPLNGYEVEITEFTPDRADLFTCHLCFIAKDEQMRTPVCWHRSKYLFCNAPKYVNEMVIDESQPDYERTYDVACINDMIRKAREANFFVTYNHPVWSVENYEIYGKLEGMNAMEMVNYGCVVEGYLENNERVYDDLLRQGKRLWCIDADDNHCHHPQDSSHFDACGAWTMIKAPSLTYPEIIESLEKGRFYSSTGPEIYSLYVEDGRLNITTSPAKKIVLTTGHRRAEIRYPKPGQPLTGAVGDEAFYIKPGDKYVRVTVFDEHGETADTNAYWVDELL